MQIQKIIFNFATNEVRNWNRLLPNLAEKLRFWLTPKIIEATIWKQLTDGDNISVRRSVTGDQIDVVGFRNVVGQKLNELFDEIFRHGTVQVPL